MISFTLKRVSSHSGVNIIVQKEYYVESDKHCVCLASQAHLENRRSQHHSIAKRFTRPDGSKLLYIGRESIMPGRSGWPMPHDAPYIETINQHLMAVVEVVYQYLTHLTCFSF